ncbi:MAG: hypothetical protein M1831_006257 [Alyxoria varia]|nr:MAG: hypothetical protein M1831_006257 [Alyxoria varia]
MASTDSDLAAISGPQLNLLYEAPGFTNPKPENVRQSFNGEDPIFNWGGVKIMRISPKNVVKFGPHVTVVEAKSMLYVAQHAGTVPVPKILAYYTYGPIERDIEDYGSLYDTYIFMDFVEGQSLDTVWEPYNDSEKNRVSSQLKQHIHDLRNIGCCSYIGSVDHGPVTDSILSNFPHKGPFDTEEDFNHAMIDAYQATVPRRYIKNFLLGMIAQKKHQIVFTHGDLRLQNIMVKDGNIIAILDWEFSGWYPEYWEFSRALYVWRWQNDWIDYLMRALEPYYAEYAFHSFLSQMLW